jgi:hypothetical protein
MLIEQMPLRAVGPYPSVFGRDGIARAVGFKTRAIPIFLVNPLLSASLAAQNGIDFVAEEMDEIATDELALQSGSFASNAS